MRGRTAGVAGSLILHAAVLAALLHATATAPKPPPKHTAVPIHALDDRSRLSGELHRGAGLACGGYHYQGIGVTMNPGSGTILDVGPNTPAEAAGLAAGDLLLEPSQLGPDMHPDGTRLVLLVLRDGRELAVTVVIGRICNE